MEITFNLLHGKVYIEGKKVSLDHHGAVIPNFPGKVRNLRGSHAYEKEFQFTQKFVTLKSDVFLVIRFDSKEISSICIFFAEIVFFDKSILESKIIRRFERKYGVVVHCIGRTVGEVGIFLLGTAQFFYDARQGDLALCFLYNVSHENVSRVKTSK